MAAVPLAWDRGAGSSGSRELFLQDASVGRGGRACSGAHCLGAAREGTPAAISKAPKGAKAAGREGRSTPHPGPRGGRGHWGGAGAARGGAGRPPAAAGWRRRRGDGGDSEAAAAAATAGEAHAPPAPPRRTPGAGAAPRRHRPGRGEGLAPGAPSRQPRRARAAAGARGRGPKRRRASRGRGRAPGASISRRGSGGGFTGDKSPPREAMPGRRGRGGRGV